MADVHIRHQPPQGYQTHYEFDDQNQRRQQQQYRQQQSDFVKGYPSHQSQHQQYQGSSSASNVIAIATLVPIGGALLVLAGLTLAGTIIGLAMSTPLFVICSPVLVPAALVLALAVAGILTSGAFGVTALSSFSWLAHYLNRSRLPEQMGQTVQETTGYLGQKVQETAGYLGQKVQETGEIVGQKMQETGSQVGKKTQEMGEKAQEMGQYVQSKAQEGGRDQEGGRTQEGGKTKEGRGREGAVNVTVKS